MIPFKFPEKGGVNITSEFLPDVVMYTAKLANVNVSGLGYTVEQSKNQLVKRLRELADLIENESW